MLKQVLVVGGAGYVGSVLVRELLERGYSVRVLDRAYFGTQGLSQVSDRIKLVISDMRRLEDSLLDDIEAVINIGGLSNDPTAEYNPKANYEINTLATEKLAKLCKQKGVKRFVFASSCSIYDRGVEDEKEDIVLDETAEVDPKATYARSKFDAEKILLEMADKDFCPVILRKGTLYGFSPRMRYDLVVNTFVKDALLKGNITIHYCGEMWRPLADVKDAARAYVTCMEAPETKVKGQIFNLVYKNFRISELALRVRDALKEVGVNTEVKLDYTSGGVRNYRVSGEKIEHILGFKPNVSIEASAKDMVQKIKEYGYLDFDNPRYYNIRWMKYLEEADKIIRITNSVFEAPP